MMEMQLTYNNRVEKHIKKIVRLEKKMEKKYIKIALK